MNNLNFTMKRCLRKKLLLITFFVLSCRIVFCQSIAGNEKNFSDELCWYDRFLYKQVYYYKNRFNLPTEYGYFFINRNSGFTGKYTYFKDGRKLQSDRLILGKVIESEPFKDFWFGDFVYKTKGFAESKVRIGINKKTKKAFIIGFSGEPIGFFEKSKPIEKSITIIKRMNEFSAINHFNITDKTCAYNYSKAVLELIIFYNIRIVKSNRDFANAYYDFFHTLETGRQSESLRKDQAKLEKEMTNNGMRIFPPLVKQVSAGKFVIVIYTAYIVSYTGEAVGLVKLTVNLKKNGSFSVYCEDILQPM